MDNDNLSEYAIALENIYKSFGSVTVLKGVNFHVKKGTIQALVGGNGAGKSTLMKILAGIHAYDRGTMKIYGENVKFSNAIDARQNGIRMIFQELSLSPTLTVTENIFLGNEIKKVVRLNKKLMAEKTQQLLDELQINARPTDRIQDLGIGVCQLIEIVKALSFEEKILIMDEPTASLTDHETNILFNIIRNLKKKGVSIVFISHRMKDIFKIADNITVLRDGNIVADKPKSEYTMDSLIEYMIGRGIEKKMEFVKREKPVSEEILLDVENLSVGKEVKYVNFKVHKGEILGIAGLLGSGRTETLEALFGKRKCCYNKIMMNGKQMNIKNINQAINNGIVLIPEDRRRYGLVLEHSVKENICLPNLKKLKSGIKINKLKATTIAEKCVESFSIKTDNINAGMLSLSGGNQQKVVIAKWMETEPKLLLMDEPTAGVDILSKGEIIDLIRRFSAEGKSVIFVSSEISEMMAICDRILVYSAGKIVDEFFRNSLENEETLEYAIQHQ
jgi:ribose transport system ATP-binding protein